MKNVNQLPWWHFSNSADLVRRRLELGTLEMLKLSMKYNQGVTQLWDNWRQILSFCFQVFAICSFMACQQIRGSAVLVKLFVWQSLWDQSLMNINGFEEIISGGDNPRAGWSTYTTNSTSTINLSSRNNLSDTFVLWFLKIIKCMCKNLKDEPWKLIFSVLNLDRK